MKVLIACEFSGIVRDAFLARGHDALSCDLLPTDSPGPHYQGDVLDIIGDGWDMMIAHPPCTYLCSSGLHWNKRTPGRQELTDEAINFIRFLLGAPIPKIALENPIGCISTIIRKPDQVIQPWQFGHPETKATCLWLKSLPLLQSTEIVWGGGKRPAAWVTCQDCEDWFCTIHREHVGDCACSPLEDWIDKGKDPYEPGTGVWMNQTPSGQNKLGPSNDRWKLRSTTYQGIAEAMAEQWALPAVAWKPATSPHGGENPLFDDLVWKEVKG